MPVNMEEEFLRQVLEYENAEPTTLFRLLETRASTSRHPTNSTTTP